MIYQLLDTNDPHPMYPSDSLRYPSHFRIKQHKTPSMIKSSLGFLFRSAYPFQPCSVQIIEQNPVLYCSSLFDKLIETKETDTWLFTCPSK